MVCQESDTSLQSSLLQQQLLMLFVLHVSLLPRCMSHCELLVLAQVSLVLSAR